MKEEQQDNKHQGIDPKTGLKNDEGTPLYVAGDTSLQSPEEDAHDRSVDPRQDSSREASRDDLHETASDRLAGSDRAGTFERKDNNMSEDGEA